MTKARRWQQGGVDRHLILGVAAGTIDGVVGFGASIMLLPVLASSFGSKETIPIMAIASLMANASRVAVWWREVGWKLNAVYCTAACCTAAFLAYGLTEGSFIASEAFASAAISLTKAATFHTLDALSPETIWRGLTVGLALMIGSWLSKHMLLTLDAHRFQVIIEVMMAAADLSMLGGALGVF